MVRWMRASLGRSAANWRSTVDFWSRVTDTRAGDARAGDVLLRPNIGDVRLELSHRDTAPPTRLDLVVADAEASLREAIALGATSSNDDNGRLTARSPGGLTFALETGDRDFVEPPALKHADGSKSSLNQVCIDVGPADWDPETAFWSQLTGFKLRMGARPEYRWIKGPDRAAFRLLLQRLDEDQPTRAHLDFSCSDIPAVREVHVDAGARSGEEYPWWTVMYDPDGVVYCLTARSPDSGDLPN